MMRETRRALRPAPMCATVVVCSNPFAPAQGMRVRAVRNRRRSVADLAPATAAPFIALHNGRPLLRAAWSQTRLADGDVLQFVALPQGGNGGKILRTVAIIAIVAYSGGAASSLGFTQGTAAFAFAKAGIVLAGVALVNALIPPPRPPIPTSGNFAAPSPTYSLQAQGNFARVGSAIPVQYGRHICYPDFAAEPYAEFVGNEQYLYQLLCIGQGEYEVGVPQLEDTPVTSFEEVSYEFYGPGQQVTLFPTNVETSSEVAGGEVPGATTKSASASQTGTTLTITEAGHGRQVGDIFAALIPLTWPDPFFDPAGIGLPDLSETLSGTFTVASVIDGDSYTINQTRTREGATGTATIVVPASPVGPFVAVDSGKDANYLAVDMVCSRGLYFANDDGSFSAKTVRFTVEAQEVDDAGTPVGGWFTLRTESITAATNTPQRRSYRYAVAAARYRVRMTRLDVKDNSTRAGHELNWAGLRAYIPGAEDYGNVTLLAMRLKANASLSQAASRKVNVVATRKLPVWNGSAWSAPQTTRSIAWALADAARNTDYGARLPDARIDLEALLALDATWAARGDTFDARFDSATTFWEAAAQIARAGRAKVFQQGGVLRVVRDQAQTLPVALFTPRNTVRGSLKVDYLMPTAETADCVTVSYFDADTWSEQEVTAALPGSSSATPARVQLFGVTSRAQAWREGMYMAACNRYRRRAVSLSTEMEGFIPSFGDLVAVSNERLSAAQFGELTAWDAGTNTATLSEPVTFGVGAHYIALRRKDGSMSGPYEVTAGMAANQVVLAEAPDFTPYTGGAAERTHFGFGTATTYRQLCLVAGARPRGETVELSFIAEYLDGNGDAYVHLADTGTPPAALQPWQLPRIFAAPRQPTGVTVSETLVNLANVIRTRMDVSWDFDPNAEGYRVAWRVGDAQWNQLPETTATSISVIDVPVSTVQVRVIAFSGARESAPATATADILGKTAKPANVSNFRIGGEVLTWTANTEVDLAGYRLRFNYGTLDTWDSATPMHEGLIVSSPYALVTRPSGICTLLIKAVDTSGNESDAPATIVLNLGDQDVSNILFSQDEHSAFTGTKTYCGVDGGVLKAAAIDRFFYPPESSAFKPATESAFGGGTFSDMVYEWTFDAPADGTVLLQYQITGERFVLEYRLGDQSAAFLPADTPAFSPTDEPFFGTPTDWAVWPGSVVLPALQRVAFRLTVIGGNTQGQVVELTSILDVPDIVEDFNDLPIAPGGTRLPITRTYRVIRNVKLALQADGGSGISARWVDKDEELGPLVEVVDGTGASVAGVLDATTQGY